MECGLNYRAEHGFVLTFENGWAININKLRCGHCSVTIVPRTFYENQGAQQMANNPYYTDEAMEARGDYIDHFKLSDDELLDLIVEISCRPPEPSLAKIGQAILKVVR